MPLGVDTATLECVDFAFEESDGSQAPASVWLELRSCRAGHSIHGDASAVVTRIYEPLLQADALLKLVAPLARPFEGLEDPRAVPYAGRYRLIFSLMNEDALQESWLASWGIREALERRASSLWQVERALTLRTGHIIGSLQSLDAVHNFTLETRIQRLAPLALDPERVEHDGRTASVVDEAMLKTFINEDGWNLGKISF